MAILKLDWLISCIAEKAPAKENDFYYNLRKTLNQTDTVDAPSPSSKKNIHSMTHSFRQPLPKKGRKLEFTAKPNDFSSLAADATNAEDQTLVSKYLKNAVPTAPLPQTTTPSETISTLENVEHEAKYVVPVASGSSITASTSSDTRFSYDSTSMDTENQTFLNGITLCITGFVDEINDEIMSQLLNAGGKVVDIHVEQNVDYAILPLDMLVLVEMKVHAQNVVNELWVVSI